MTRYDLGCMPELFTKQQHHDASAHLTRRAIEARRTDGWTINTASLQHDIFGYSFDARPAPSSSSLHRLKLSAVGSP